MADAGNLERLASEAAGSLPALLTEADRAASSLAAGNHGRRRPGTGETFWQYRDYAFGDAASAIDWRQSARVPDRYFVRQTEWETAAAIHLWADGGDSLDYASGDVSKRWRAQVCAVALASLLVRGGERVGPMDGLARSGRAGLVRLAESLIVPCLETLPPLPPERANRAVLISDFHEHTEAVLDRFASIRRSGLFVHIVQIGDPAEVAFPYGGRTLFHSPSGTEQREYGDADSLRTAYSAAREAHLGALADACSRFGWTFQRHVTDAPLTPTLAGLHAAMAQGAR